jgi:peptidoglycan LD-endopeptidase LytH
MFTSDQARRSRAAAAVAATVVAAAVLVPARFAPVAADPLEDAKRSVVEAQGAADQATARYAEAQTRHAQVGNEIEGLEAAIRAGKERAALLTASAERQAAAAYRSAGGGAPFAGFVDGEPLAVARRQKLLDDSTAGDIAALDELARLNEDLEAQRADLEARRAEQEEALAAMDAEADRLEAELATAQRAQAEVEERIREEEAARREAARRETERQAQDRAAREQAAPTRPHSSSGGTSGGGSGSTGGIICPIRGPVSFVDSWHAPRHQGPHLGVDLMSPRGTSNVAVVSGDAEMRGGGISGNGVRLHGDDGNLYYYFHLDGYAGGSRHVSQGDVVGYTGNTGDASGGPPHTHFEIHPGGGAAVNPYPAVRAVC